MSSVGLVGNQSERMETKKDTTTKYEDCWNVRKLQADISQTQYDLDCLEYAMEHNACYRNCPLEKKRRRNLKACVARYKRHLVDYEVEE